MAAVPHKKTRRDFLKGMGAGAAALAAGAAALPLHGRARNVAVGKERPNILFICTDYQSAEDNPFVESPFLDMPAMKRLCENGVYFDRYFSTAPVCMPARHTWYTGQYPHSHGVWNNGAQMDFDAHPLLMRELTRGGYHPYGVGKMHVKPWDKPIGFKRWISADRKANGSYDSQHEDDYAKFLAERGLHRMDYLKLQGESTPFGCYHWPFDDECHIDHFVGAQAAGLIENEEMDGPWFLFVSFNGPHNPWDPPERFTTPYMEMDLPEPRIVEGELETKPIYHTQSRYGYTGVICDYVDRNPDKAAWAWKRIRAGHYGNLTFIDRQVEKILAALEKRGELDDTIVVWSADHGAHLGGHNMIHKNTHYDRSARVPFVVHCPARFKPKRTQAFGGHVDFLQTILDMAGVAAPEGVEGRSLLPVVAGETDSVQDEVFIEIKHNTSIITDGWKMGFYPEWGEYDLYDLEKDPHCVKNLASDPACADRKEQLKRRMIAFRPALEMEMAKPAPVLEDKLDWTFEQGDELRPWFTPRQAERVVEVSTRIEPKNGEPMQGVVFTWNEWVRQGYALLVKDGRLHLATRLWGEDALLSAARPLPEAGADVGFVWRPDGRLLLMQNGETVAEGKRASGPPKRPGRRGGLVGAVHCGEAPPWSRPIADAYEKETPFQGAIATVRLHLEEA